MGFRIRSILISIGLAACSTTPLMPLYGTSYTDKAEHFAQIPPIQTTMLVANLAIDEKRFKFELEGKDPMPIDMVKAHALNHAVMETGADVVVEPHYSVEVTQQGYRVTITGYPARYVRIRTGTNKDKRILRAAAGEQAKPENPKAPKTEVTDKVKALPKGSQPRTLRGKVR